MAVLYQVWVPAVVVAHVVGLTWLAWSVGRLCGASFRARLAGISSAAARLLHPRRTRPSETAIPDVEAQVSLLPPSPGLVLCQTPQGQAGCRPSCCLTTAA